MDVAPSYLKFSNPNTLLLVNGKQRTTREAIAFAFGNPQDREVYVTWADLNPKIVKENSHLEDLYQKIKTIGASVNFGGDHAFKWIPPIKKVTQEEADQLFQFIQTRNISALLANINRLKLCLETRLLEEPLISGIIPQLINNANWVNDLFDIEDIANCMHAGSIDLEKLVSIRLQLSSENYQDVNKQDYEKLIGKLYHFVRSLSINDSEKSKLNEHIAENERQEQRTFLQYASKEEIEKINNYFDNPLVDPIVNQIIAGLWMPIFKVHGQDENLAYIFLAAYCQKKISLDDLVTAMIFHRAYFNAADKFQICPINADSLTKFGYNQNQIQEWDSILKRLPDHQKVACVFHRDIFDEFTSGVIRSSFFKFHIPGVIINKNRGIFSFGLVRKYFKNYQINLTPILHLTPRFSLVANRLAKLKSDFAIFLPKEKTMIHGSEDATIFSPMHDLFHATARIRAIQYHPTMMCFVKDLIAEKKVLLSNKILVPYRKKLFPSKGNVNQKFKSLPNQMEFITFILDRFIGEIIDSTYKVSEFISRESVLTDLMGHVVQTSWNELPVFKDRESDLHPSAILNKLPQFSNLIKENVNFS